MHKTSLQGNQETKSFQLNPYLGFSIIFFFALIIRIFYMIQQWGNPFSSFPLSDSVHYLKEAELIIRGNSLGTKIFTYGGEAFYTYFLALLLAIFGEKYFTIILINHVMGAVSSGLIYIIGNYMYGLRTGIILGIWGGLLSPLLFHEGHILTTAPAIMFFLLSLYTLFAAANKQSIAISFLAGVFLGLTILCRPNFLLFIPIYFVWLFLLKPISPLKNLLPYFLLIGISMTILPVTLRNYMVGKDLVLISSGGGFNFYLGNNPDATGLFHIPEGSGIEIDESMYVSSHKIAEINNRRKMKPSEVSRYWFNEGLSYITAQPHKALSLYWKKLILFWNKVENTNIYEYDFFKKYSFFLRNPLQSFGPVAVIGLLGALSILAVRGASREEMLLPALIFTYMMSVIIFFVSSRLRVPVTPLLLLSGGYVIKRFRFKPPAKTDLLPFLAFSLITLFIYQNIENKTKRLAQSDIFTNIQLARKFTESGDYKQAMMFFEKALETDPYNPLILANAGIVAEKMDNSPLALDLYQKIIANKNLYPVSKLNPMNKWALTTALLRTGIIFLNSGNIQNAESVFKSVLIQFPEHVEAHKYLGLIYEKTGNIKGAIYEFKTYLSFSPDDQQIKKRWDVLKRYKGER